MQLSLPAHGGTTIFSALPGRVKRGLLRADGRQAAHRARGANRSAAVDGRKRHTVHTLANSHAPHPVGKEHERREGQHQEQRRFCLTVIFPKLRQLCTERPDQPVNLLL